MRMWRMKRDDLLTKKIIARKKKIRLKRIKNYTKRKIQIFDENATSIIDSEVKWKTSNFTWLIEKIKKTKTKLKHQISINQQQNEKENVKFIIDTINDFKLRNAMLKNDDFVIFEETKSDENVQRHLKKIEKSVFNTIT